MTKTSNRLILYAVIAAGNFFLSHAKEGMTLFQWIFFGVGMAVDVATTMRAFIDQSVSREETATPPPQV